MTIGLGNVWTPVSTTGATSLATGSGTSQATGSGFVVYVLQATGSPAIISLTDHFGNSYTHIAQVTDGGNRSIDRFYCQGTGGSGQLFTATASASTPMSIFAVELTGAAASFYDSASPAVISGFAGPPYSSNSFSASPPSGGEMLLSLLSTEEFSASITYTYPTGWTSVSSITAGTAGYPAAALAMLAISSSGTQQATGWSDGSGGSQIAVTLDGFFGATPPAVAYLPFTQKQVFVNDFNVLF